MSGEIKENIARRSIWLRLCFMIIMWMALGLAEIILGAVVVFQFFYNLFTARTNDPLIRFGRNLARYLQQITLYLTFVTEDVPFPFMPWPDEPHEPAPVEEGGGPPDENPPTATDVADDDDDVEQTKAPDAPAAEAAARPDDKPKAAGHDAPVTGATAKPDDKPKAAGDDAVAGTKAADAPQTAVFADSTAYQKFMGERSRLGGKRFVDLLALPPRLSWLDVGCGTGAFSAVILENCDPSALIGIDSSEPQVTHAQAELGNAKASFRVADATALPFEVDSFDVAVSSYTLNFVPNKQKMVDEMARVVRPEGTVAASVFDVAGGRQSSHHIWELIGRNDPAFHKAEFERRGWNITHPEALTAFFENAGLEDVSVESIEIDETFADFDEYWASMTVMPTSGTSTYISGLDEDELQKFKDELKSVLPIDPDGSIKLVSGSWVVRGKVPA